MHVINVYILTKLLTIVKVFEISQMVFSDRIHFSWRTIALFSCYYSMSKAILCLHGENSSLFMHYCRIVSFRSFLQYVLGLSKFSAYFKLWLASMFEIRSC